ncbi:DUF362 domain-containing protein [Pelotomaculum sp. PtaB.Bin117]|uniref:DUF362 domain-containing protein n=1 Tax=Pelotomaculum sp. PtaB.Bin117 TaxID=1811694 RepID=UPI0009C9A1AF|nr:DUF362 domain-containing protein [Pelotomaculum sp. PtaB.Bin117]OPX87129.1 MAG: hypothetical protein A4E54_01792 [Pelotomaculum sp. PtaB.Bin117]OPY62233.1 MAG: hypothetical protein A4E56_01490 [Pelotomaculum sp. PtaU1.Bin065]
MENLISPPVTGGLESIVGIGLGSYHSDVTRRAIENAGGLRGIIKENDTVVIKPNLVKQSLPEEGIVTDYRVVQEIVNIVKECGAGKIVIAEATPFGNIFDLVNYHKISGAILFDMNECDEESCYKLRAKNSLTKEALFIPKLYMDADVVIGAAKLKTHFEYDAAVSLSLKNSMGVPPTKFYGAEYYGEDYKEKLHLMGLKEVIVDLNKIRKPDFVVIDGIIGGEGYGPLKVRPIQSNVVMAGIDPVAVDTVALSFMGFTVNEVPHVQLASREGLGISDLSKIKIIGADLNLIKMKFQRA